MLLIGERINGMFRDVKKAIENKDKKVILSLAEQQIECGADYLDISTGPVKNSIDAMKWLVETVQEIKEAKLCIDSTKKDVLETGLSIAKHPPFLNSVSADPEKLTELLPMAQKYNASVIALTMDAEGIPVTCDKRVEAAAMILATACELNFPTEKIYIDPLILPISAVQESPGSVLKSLAMIKELDIPAPKTILGLSNVSQKCSGRNLINKTFLAMALAYGLDGAILDVCAEGITDTIYTSEIILNQNIYCNSYLTANKKN